MWEPKIDSTSNQSQSTTTTNTAPRDLSGDKYDKLNIVEDIDSGFLSSEQILNSGFSSYGEEDDPGTSTSLGDTDTKPIPASVADEDKKLSTADADCTYLDSGLVDDIELSTRSVAAEAEDAGKMLLERELDNGLAEWLCTLDLKNGGGGANQINNLSRKVDSATASLDQLNISDAPSATKRTKATSARPTVEVPEKEEPWEVCYIQDGEGDTYLHLAVSDGNEEFVRNLIKITPHPCLLDIQNDLLQSPLHLAVLVGNVKIVRMLLLAGAETSIRDKFGNTPMHLACASGDLDCVRALTERITTSEETNGVSCTGVLLSKSAEGATNAKQTRQHFIQYADVELINYDGERCVHLVTSIAGPQKDKHIDMMRELVVRCGADVNAREGKAGYTALHMAVERGDKDLVKFMLEECTSLNLEVASYGRWTAYQIATVNRNQELMSLLRSKGAEELDVSSSDESDDSDVDENEIMDMYGHSATGYYCNDRRIPTAINVA